MSSIGMILLWPLHNLGELRVGGEWTAPVEDVGGFCWVSRCSEHEQGGKILSNNIFTVLESTVSL